MPGIIKAISPIKTNILYIIEVIITGMRTLKLLEIAQEAERILL